MLNKLCIIKAMTFVALLTLVSNISAEEQLTTKIVDRLECAGGCAEQYAKLKRFARNGSPRAQTLLGLMYKTGEFEIKRDPDQAWRWMKRAKLQRYAPAMYYISEWYREGFREDVDVAKADDYLQRSSERGYIPAIFQLGMRLMEKGQYAQGMVFVNLALESKYPLAIKFKELLDSEFDKQLNSASDKTVVLTPRDNAQMSGRPETLVGSDSDNKLVIYGSKEDPQLLLVNLMKDLEGIALYNTRGYTGSRVGDLKCGQGGSFCRTIKFNDGFGYDTFIRNVLGGR